MKMQLIILVFFGITLPTINFGQVLIDSTFGSNGKVITDINNSSDFIRAIAIQSDNKIVVAGSTYESFTEIVLGRYMINGVLDTTFGNNGIVKRMVGNKGTLNDIKILPDMSIIGVGGACMSDYYHYSFLLVKYKSDGTIDNNFGNSGVVTIKPGFTDIARSMQIQDDGKIVVAGETHSGSGSDYDFALIRFLPNGSLDSTFGNNGIVVTDLESNNDFLVEIKSQNNRIIALGNSALVRYNENGTIDRSFGQSGILNISEVYLPSAFEIQSDDKIVVAAKDCSLVRYYPDGEIDNTFGINGIASSSSMLIEYPSALRIQENGDIVIGSTAWTGVWRYFSLARYKSSGTLDSLFGYNGYLETEFYHYDNCFDIEFQLNDKIVAAGTIGQSSMDWGLVRYNNDFVVSNIDRKLIVNIYPNPSNNWIQIKLKDASVKQFEISNLNGQIVHKGIINESGRINISHLKKGIYVIAIKCNQMISYSKLVKN